MVEVMGENGDDHPDSFYKSMKPLLLVGQVCGVFPIHGSRGAKHTDLRFSWYNWQFIHVGITFAASLFFNIVSTKDNLSEGIRLDNFGSTIFYSVCNLNTIFFVDLARNWPDLSKNVFLIEKSMGPYGYPKSMATRIKVFLAVFLLLSTFEHGLLTYLNVLGALDEADREGKPFLKCFFEYRFPVILDNVKYTDATVIFVFLVTVICTFNWNYLDYFLSCLSIQLSSKLKQLNIRLDNLAQDMGDDNTFWSQMCDDYNNLSILTKDFECYISKFVLMSCVSNFYHLSLQLLRSLKFKGDTNAMVYFYFSMAYLLLRTMTVLLCGARIHEESKKAKTILFECKKCCVSADRLLMQVIHDDVCLTGKKFFSVNRLFIVTMIGTLVTYEVILLQLNSLRYEETRL